MRDGARRFKLVTPEQVGEPVIDIPHPGFMEGIGPVRLVNDFERDWGVKAKAVALPVALPDGLMFDVDGLPGAKSPSGATIRDQSGREYDYHGLVAEFIGLGLDIYLVLDPIASFLNMPALQLVDSQQNTAPSVCIAKKRTQEILGAILGTGLDIASDEGAVSGIGIDTSNLWPMGAREGLIQATCFCPECLEQGGDAFQAILTDTGAFNLGLKDQGEGISFIEDIRSDMRPEQLMDLARSRGFTTRSGPPSHATAQILLDYMRARHAITVRSLESVLEIAIGEVHPGVPAFVICENADYAWTSGLFLRDFDLAASSPARVAEIWLDSSGTGIPAPQRLPYRTYLWRRSRYHIDEFLKLAATLSDPRARVSTGVSRLDALAAEQLLRRRLERMVGSSTSEPKALASLDSASSSQVGRRGFVAVALNAQMGDGFLRRLAIAPVHDDPERQAFPGSPGSGGPGGAPPAG